MTDHAPTDAPANPAEAALLAHIVEQSKTDPLIGAKLGSREVTHRLIAGMKTDRGVHVDSILCALGALAGYACQVAVRARAAAQGLPEDALFTTVQTVDGKTLFFGDQLNQPLAEDQYSVWAIAASGAQQAGCETFPDLNQIFQHVANDVGSEAFGVPRVPEEHKAHELPLSYLHYIWPALLPMFEKFCPDRTQWPIMLALSAQEVIIMAKDAIDPALALTIVMESAVPMSKVTLNAG